jgi:hypothetical protein
VLATLVLCLGSWQCNLLHLLELPLGETIELHEILHGFLAFFLQQIYLTTYKVCITEFRKLINAFSCRHKALVMFTNFPLDYRFHQMTELLSSLLCGYFVTLQVHTHL